jgi:transcriptional regulator with PAS, ATPase and Fis domain
MLEAGCPFFCFADPRMASLQSIAIELASLLDDSQAPVYVLDEDRRIMYCNPACARWTGVEAGELLGQQCVYQAEIADASPQGIAAGLCPPPKTFSGHVQTAVVGCSRAGGRVDWRRGNFLPLSDGEDESAAVIAVLETADCPAPDSAPADADHGLHDQLRQLRGRMAERYRLDALVGVSPAITRVRSQMKLAAETAASVLIIGETGSGKDHVAKAIHYGAREVGSLLPLDCSLLPVNSLRNALRAAWSPSPALKEPITLLLSDVDAMPAEAQSDLEALQASHSRRVRLVATAAQPLAELVAAGRFSAGLAYALATVTIELPPLVARLEDLPLLAQAFLEEANAQSTKQIGGVSRDALDRLAAYAWPGNIDELADVIRQAHQRATGGEITARDLASQILWAADAGAHPPRADEAIVLGEFLKRVEKELIVRAMRRAKNNKSKAARLLGLTRPRLYRRLIQLGLEPPGDAAAQ